MNKKIESIALRYLTILVFGLGNLFLIYSLFTPLTYYSVSFILSLFGNVINFYDLRIIIFNQISIELVNACIAGSAYFLLIILNFSIPNIQNARRIKLLFVLYDRVICFKYYKNSFNDFYSRTRLFCKCSHVFLVYNFNTIRCRNLVLCSIFIQDKRSTYLFRYKVFS
jgi:hypothetical protein